MTVPNRLPEPDGRGNYYFGFLKTLPAIFVIQSRRNPDRGKYFPCPSGAAPIPLGEGGRLKAYDTPEEALRELRRLERGR